MALKVNKPKEELADDGNVVEQVEAAEAEGTSEPVAETESTPEAEEAGEIVDDEPHQEAESTSANVPAVSGLNQNLSSILKELQTKGFEGIGLEFGTFPLLSLDKGEFKINDKILGKISFQCTPLASSRKYCYRNEPQTSPMAEKDKDQVWEENETAHLAPGSASAIRIAEWAEKGWTYKISEYLNILVHMHTIPAAPELEGMWVMLSVPPTSKKYFSSASIMCKTKGYDPHECVFEIAVGERIKGNQADWYPWSFTAKGSLKKLGLEIKYGVKDEDF